MCPMQCLGHTCTKNHSLISNSGFRLLCANLILELSQPVPGRLESPLHPPDRLAHGPASLLALTWPGIPGLVLPGSPTAAQASRPGCGEGPADRWPVLTTVPGRSSRSPRLASRDPALKHLVRLPYSFRAGPKRQQLKWWPRAHVLSACSMPGTGGPLGAWGAKLCRQGASTLYDKPQAPRALAWPLPGTMPNTLHKPSRWP